MTPEGVTDFINLVKTESTASTSDKRRYIGRITSSITDVTTNEQGKILIPRTLCDQFGFETPGDIVVVGEDQHFFIVPSANYQKAIAKDDPGLAAINEQLGFF